MFIFYFVKSQTIMPKQKPVVNRGSLSDYKPGAHYLNTFQHFYCSVFTVGLLPQLKNMQTLSQYVNAVIRL